MKAALRRALKPAWMAVARRAARAYVAGDTVADAVRVCRRWHGKRVLTTIGYWNDGGEDPVAVQRQGFACLEALERRLPRDYLSLKLGALHYRHDLVDPLVDRAAAGRFRAHFDSLGPETVDRTNAFLDAIRDRHPDIGCTLPGRWRRSIEDAEWACDRGYAVRVVKGQWEDPDAPGLESRAGYAAVIDALAGRARSVAIATHDVVLAERCLRRLKAAGTPADLELLHGLPMRQALALARRLRVPVRVYVPYGASWLPYSMSYVQQNPRVLLWLARDMLGG